MLVPAAHPVEFLLLPGESVLECLDLGLQLIHGGFQPTDLPLEVVSFIRQQLDLPLQRRNTDPRRTRLAGENAAVVSVRGVLGFCRFGLSWAGGLLGRMRVVGVE
jgi:hypothetical protein